MPARPAEGDPTSDEAAPAASSVPNPAVVSSSDLLAGRRELVIRHGAERYRLMLTAQNKLILTK